MLFLSLFLPHCFRKVLRSGQTIARKYSQSFQIAWGPERHGMRGINPLSLQSAVVSVPPGQTLENFSDAGRRDGIFSVSRVCRMGPGNMMSKQLSVTPLSPFLVIPRWIGFCFSLKRSGVHAAMHKDTGVIAKMPPSAGNPITMAAWFHTTPVKMSRSEHLKDLAPLALGRCGGGWKKINIGRY